MNCLVTGVAGFVGSCLADKLLAEGHKVRGIDCFLDYYPREVKLRNIAAARKHPAFEFLDQSLLKTDLSKLLQGIDWIFHQAGQAGVRASWGTYFETYVKNNILATQVLLEAVKETGTLKKFVFASSSSVYGNAESFPTSEDVVPRPVSPYGVTKLASEHLVSLYASQYGVPGVSLRYFTVFGPRQRPDMGFHRFIRAGLLGEEIILFGDGEQSRDFTYIDDIVEANILAAKHGGAGAVYNIGGGAQVSINDVFSLLEARIGKLKIRREPTQLGDARHTSADISRATGKLRYQPKISVKRGIEREIEWLRKELKETQP